VGEREPRLVGRGKAALKRLDEALAAGDFLGGRDLSLADISLVAYTRVAGEGGFRLADYPRVQAWIARVEQALNIAD
jgi:glutathione S-transferase